jgi:antitoxin (DNA-binding transcriptional repressor) of toxin-antitoxin stability system
MPKKTLQQVAEDEVIHKLSPIVEFVEVKIGRRLDFDHSRGPVGDMSLKEVWGVKEAKTQLPTLLREASAGEIHFVTAGDGSAIVMMSAKNLAEAMATLDERRGLTLSDAVAQLPYPRSELKPVKLKRHAPARRLLQRTRVAEQV